MAAAVVGVAALISASFIVVAPGFQKTETTTSTVTSTTTSVRYLTSTAATAAIVTSLATSTTTVTLNPAANQPCDTHVWNWDNFVWNAARSIPTLDNVPVLLMRPNSTGYVCVIYQTAWQGNESLYRSISISIFSSYPYLVNGTMLFGPFLFDSYRCTVPGQANSCTQTISHSFRVTSLPSSIKLDPSMNYVTVIYAVSASSDSAGFYDEGAPWTACTELPLAVGYSASQVNASDFTQPPGHSCLVQLFLPVAEYVTGMNVTYIHRPPT